MAALSATFQQPFSYGYTPFACVLTSYTPGPEQAGDFFSSNFYLTCGGLKSQFLTTYGNKSNFAKWGIFSLFVASGVECHILG